MFPEVQDEDAAPVGFSNGDRKLPDPDTLPTGRQMPEELGHIAADRTGAGRFEFHPGLFGQVMEWQCPVDIEIILPKFRQGFLAAVKFVLNGPDQFL